MEELEPWSRNFRNECRSTTEPGPGPVAEPEPGTEPEPEPLLDIQPEPTPVSPPVLETPVVPVRPSSAGPQDQAEYTRRNRRRRRMLEQLERQKGHARGR